MANKIIKGTKDRKVNVVKGSSDIREIRCTKCKTGVASKVPDGKGGQTCRCNICGATFNFAQL